MAIAVASACAAPARDAPEPATLPRVSEQPIAIPVVGPPEPIPDCEARLAAAGVRFRAGKIPVTPTKRGTSCGAPQIVIYEAGPTAIRWNAEPVVTCQLALGLARFETLLQEYACREGCRPQKTKHKRM